MVPEGDEPEEEDPWLAAAGVLINLGNEIQFKPLVSSHHGFESLRPLLTWCAA